MAARAGVGMRFPLAWRSLLFSGCRRMQSGDPSPSVQSARRWLSGRRLDSARLLDARPIQGPESSSWGVAGKALSDECRNVGNLLCRWRQLRAGAGYLATKLRETAPRIYNFKHGSVLTPGQEPTVVTRIPDAPWKKPPSPQGKRLALAAGRRGVRYIWKNCCCISVVNRRPADVGAVLKGRFADMVLVADDVPENRVPSSGGVFWRESCRAGFQGDGRHRR